MELVYRAVDGKEFNNEIDCKAHEDSLKAKEFAGKIHLWDQDKDVVEVTSDIVNDFDHVMFFRCDTIEAYKFILSILETDSYTKGLADPINGIGVTWAWDEADIMWVNVTTLIDQLTEEIACYKSMLEGSDNE